MITSKKTLILGSATVLLAAAAYLILRPAEAPPAATGQDANMFGFVRSLEGTRPDGDLKVADGDQLVVDAELGRMFDYYLSALGEKSLEAIRAEAERELDRKLGKKAAQEAKRLLGRYLDYKRALVDVEKNQQAGGSTAAVLKARLQAMQKVRAQFFSAKEAEGLFGFNDMLDQDAIARLEVTENTQLTPEQKQQKMAAIDAAMPPQLREEKEAPLRIARVEDDVKKMRAQGASEQDIYQFRAKAFSPEAAARLAEVDQEEAQWKGRIAAYQAQRQQILAGTQSDAEKMAALTQLREAQFNEQERSRLAAYE